MFADLFLCEWRFSGMSSMLQGFLVFNQEFEVLLLTHAVFRRHNEQFKRHVPSCARHEREPNSFWLRWRGNSGPGERDC
jgi:hypothetical protein